MLLSQKLKKEFEDYCLGYTKHFVKQGSFSLYHSKELDNFVKKAYLALLDEFFESFLPTVENIPFCVIATKAYSDFKLGANEALPLLFIYKDIKAFNLKPMIKAFIALLNDIGLVIEYQICELSGIVGKSKDLRAFGVRYLCGSKTLFKLAREEFKRGLNLHKKEFVEELFAYFQGSQGLSFIKQEFNIKKDFGGIEDYARLDSLLSLFKEGPKNYALDFITEKELSELRLAMDFILSLKSAMNIQSKKDIDIFSLANAQNLSLLMRKKDKKHLDAKQSLLQKALSCMHTVGIYTRFIATEIQRKESEFKFEPINEGIFCKAKNRIFLNKREKFSDIKGFLNALHSLNDEYLDFDLSLAFYLRQMRLKGCENSLLPLKTLLYRRHSFCVLKLLFDSGVLKDLIKAYAPLYFLPDEESVYSRDENAFLILREFERQMNDYEVLKNLSSQERMMTKLSILMSASNEENEVSLANIYRALCSKFNISSDLVEFGLILFKNFYLMKDFVEKEDIYNESIIGTLISRLKSLRNLKILYALSLISARALNIEGHFFYKGLDALLNNALAGFENAEFLDESTRRVKKEQTLRRSREFLQLDSYMQDKITHIESNLFIIKNPFEKIIKIAKIARENDFKFWLDNEKNFILELVSENKKLDLQGILNALSSLNLVFMSFFQLFDDKVYLKFEYANEVSEGQKERYAELLQKNLKAHKNDFKKISIKKDELKLDLGYSKTYAKLNLNTKDEQGLMAFVMKAFNEQGLTLSAAKIQTIRQRTRNTFYLQKTPNLDEEKLLKSLTSE